VKNTVCAEIKCSIPRVLGVPYVTCYFVTLSKRPEVVSNFSRLIRSGAIANYLNINLLANTSTLLTLKLSSLEKGGKPPTN
jgi:hypothetical protein